ncbi:2-isopropylmalate synthase/homocitrate synthase [Anopheles sinensis]|uniref:2-isopropylmalate synthase/homocitrate synthase n=1 Tax=Anopheles sinensis TaxID=74873 RepID=A0A084WR04_ANOSI|nr:2-isopropylmalate synthase/homocitrate synthase [Anopheles sinensis]
MSPLHSNEVVTNHDWSSSGEEVVCFHYAPGIDFTGFTFNPEFRVLCGANRENSTSTIDHRWLVCCFNASTVPDSLEEATSARTLEKPGYVR